MPRKRTVSSPVLREIQRKREQVENQILKGAPQDYPAYKYALGVRQTLLDLEAFTAEVLAKEGDIVDVT